MNKKSIIMWLCANVVYCNANSVVPVTINQAQNELPDCKGKCKDDNWATWTQWDICKGGECHLNEGKQTRQTICFTLVTPPPSRSDGGSKEEFKREGKWLETCIEKQQRPCVRELSCGGEWTGWEKWRECEISGKSKNATCSKTRRRFCLDKKGTRQSGSHCYGGPSSDTENELCSNKSCSKIEPRIGIAEDDLIIPKKTTKQKPNILNHNTILIIAVAIGSVVFGALFVLLLLNLVRRSSGRDDESTSSRGDVWKRIGSTNTSSIGYSTGYVAASDVMSPRLDINILSPSASASLGSSSSHQHFFGRGEAMTPPISEEATEVGGLLTVSGNINSNEPPRRRSRLMQENVYWEITENTASSSDGSDDQPLPQNGDREVVRNVLYGTTV